MGLSIDNRLVAEPESTPVITSQGVVRNNKPIVFVEHAIDDGGWIMLDADTIDIDDETSATLGELRRRDPTLGELADLPLGWQARRRSSDDPWIRYPRCC